MDAQWRGELPYYAWGETFFKGMKVIVTVIIYIIFIIDVGTIVNQQLSNLEAIFFHMLYRGEKNKALPVE